MRQERGKVGDPAKSEPDDLELGPRPGYLQVRVGTQRQYCVSALYTSRSRAQHRAENSKESILRR